jgi:multiple sugar transport system permease protein
MSRLGARRRWTGLAFCSPWLLGLAGFLAFPIATAVWYSFCNYPLLRPPVFIGVDNYTELLGDDLFWRSLFNTTVFACGSVIGGVLMAFLLALLLNARVRGVGIYRTLFFLPTLVPVVATCMLWMWMYAGEGGIINHLLGMVGIDGPNWLKDAAWIKPALVLMAVWGCGHAMIILLAGLQDVPESLYEAALIDGANWWQRLIHVTIPLLSPVLYFNVIMGIIGGFQVFTQAFVMLGGQGGERNAALFYVLHLYNKAFEDLRMGYACAMAIILFAVVVTLTLAMHRLTRRFMHYER